MAATFSRWVLIVGFITFLGLPALDMQLHISPYYNPTEKRQLTPLPTLAWDQLATFPAEFEGYFRDHFGFRDLLIREYSLVQVKDFHRSLVPNVIIGDSGWLFYAGYNDGADIREFQGKQPLSDSALKQRRQALEARAALLQSHGIPYLFVIVPNKHSVYADHLPARIGPRRPGNHLDQFMSIMRGSTVPIVDLREALTAARSAGDVYFKSDSHWNAAGAFAGYRAILDAARLLVPSIRPRSSDEFTIQWSARQGGDLANMLAMADEWSDTDVLYTLRPGSPGLIPLRLVAVGDSFMWRLSPFLEQTFTHVRNEAGFALEPILQEKPDLVIEERAERYLMVPETH